MPKVTKTVTLDSSTETGCTNDKIKWTHRFMFLAIALIVMGIAMYASQVGKQDATSSGIWLIVTGLCINFIAMFVAIMQGCWKTALIAFLL